MAGLRGMLEGHRVAALAVVLLDVGGEDTPMGGSAATAAGGRAAIGSFRYCFRSSSAIGRVEKYENCR